MIKNYNLRCKWKISSVFNTATDYLPTFWTYSDDFNNSVLATWISRWRPYKINIQREALVPSRDTYMSLFTPPPSNIARQSLERAAQSCDKIRNCVIVTYFKQFTRYSGQLLILILTLAFCSEIFSEYYVFDLSNSAPLFTGIADYLSVVSCWQWTCASSSPRPTPSSSACGRPPGTSWATGRGRPISSSHCLVSLLVSANWSSFMVFL
jgi:hypothetical protein